MYQNDVWVPDVFVKEPLADDAHKRKLPGTVTLEDLTPPPDPLRFLHPEPAYRSVTDKERPIPCHSDLPTWKRRVDKFGVDQALDVFFVGHDGEEVEELRHSLLEAPSPFIGSSKNPITWKLVDKPVAAHVHALTGGKKSKFATRHRHVAEGEPWAIVPAVDDEGILRKNFIYDGDGSCFAEVDFGCSRNPKVHVHPLVRGHLDHPSSDVEHHCLPWESVPWVWLCAKRSEEVKVEEVPLPDEDFRWRVVTLRTDRDCAAPSP